MIFSRVQHHTTDIASPIVLVFLHHTLTKMHKWFGLATLALAHVSSAHFVLLWPPSAGFNDDLEPTAPCGSFTPEVMASSQKVSVDRFAISIRNAGSPVRRRLSQT